MSRHDALFARALDRAAGRAQLRHLLPGTPLSGGRIARGGQEFLNFSGNDYLGLSHHPALIAAAQHAAARFGTGAGASRLVTGTLDLHAAIEAKIAALKGTESALLFASGWQANAAVLPALFRVARDPVLVFADRLNHASLHAGCAAGGVSQIRFRHNDLDHLEALLDEHRGAPGRRFILTESVFSMDGDRADVVRLAAIAARHEAFLYLDEAHATGVLGPNGAGLASLAPGGIDLAMGTFSKALGGFGAYVAGSRLLCDYLVNACGGFIYTTAPPPPVLGAIAAALDLLPTLDAERARLAVHGEHLRAALQAAGFATGGSTTQIVPVIVGDAEATLALSARLAAAGLLVTAIRPPTVPPGTSRLRIALSAAHGDDDVDQLIAAITGR